MLRLLRATLRNRLIDDFWVNLPVVEDFVQIHRDWLFLDIPIFLDVTLKD